MFDVAIVGAGSAGCVLANRLSANEKRKVVLIEAGPPKHGSLYVRAPLLYQKLWYGKLCWGYRTVPQQHVDNREMYWPRGKVVGGSNSFNAMVYMRGHRDNYDEWGLGWTYADVLPYFKKAEDNARGASEFHGAGGPLCVDDTIDPLPVSRAFVETVAKRCGVPITDDFNGAQQEGVGFPQVTIRGGVRRSSATGYLDPIRDRPNLTVITDALACSLVIDGTRCTGVKLRVKNSEQTIDAKEVIVCGGAIGSPQLLMLSGIGVGAELPEGIEPRHELAGVGKHLEDHLLAYPVWRTKKGANHALSRLGVVGSIIKHGFTKRGDLSRGPIEAIAFVKQGEVPRPNNQIHFAPWGLVGPNSDIKRADPLGRFAAILPGLIYPRSQGEITLASNDPAATPRIDPKYFTDPADLEHLLAGVKLARELAATEPLASLLDGEDFPGPTVDTDDELRAWIRSSVNTIFHPTGTCKMGTDPMAVVDPELRVHGLEGLRVADASVMPRIIGGNTNAPTIMIAERCADFVG